MAFESFRDFINALDRAGELKCIVQRVATELEITETANRKMKSPGGGKAPLMRFKAGLHLPGYACGFSFVTGPPAMRV